MASYVLQVIHFCTLIYLMWFMNTGNLYVSQDLRYPVGERDCTKVVQKMNEIFLLFSSKSSHQ